jgi:nucleoside-diphosphate-sugar epimerase
MPKKQVITKSALVPTVLISGGAGFIGSHLAEALLENKARVVVLDNFKTGKEIHVKHLLKNPNFALYDVDINEEIPADIESVDYIFHLAGLEEYLYSKDYINLEALFTNSLGTKNLLDLARKSGAKFLLASTIDVYQGRMSQLALDEYFGATKKEENKFSLIEAKRFAEAVVWEYFKKYDLDVRIVRLPEVYGPRMDISSSGFLGGFLKNLIDGSSIEIFGEGTDKEYYLFISDVVSGLVKAEFNPKTKGNIYSLAPEDSVSALEVAYLVKSIADAKLSVLFKPGTSELKSKMNVPDTFNQKDLSWKPKVGLKDGISRTLDSFGYKTNTNAFKPNHLVDEKIKKQESPVEKLISLKGLMPEPVSKPTPKSNPFSIFKKQKEKKTKQVNQVKPVRYEKPMYVVKKGGVKISKADKSTVKRFLLPKLGEGFGHTFGGALTGIKENARDFKYRVKADVGVSMSIFAIILSAFVVFIGIPVIGTYANTVKGVNLLNKIQTSILKLDSTTLDKDTLSAYNSFRTARTSLRRMGWLFSLTKKGSNYISYDKLLGSLASFSRAANYVSTTIKPLESVFETLQPQSSKSLDIEAFNQAKLSILSAEEYLRLAEADTSGINEDLFPKKIKDKVLEYENKLPEIQKYIEYTATVVSDLPSILGSEGEKKYIFWFQNNNEIRPTGGFIGSYGVLTLDKGKIKDLVIDDIYNPDGQIDVRKIDVTPPTQISTFLKEDKLYLRNSNWNPDFPKSIKTFDDLYFKVTGDTISGYVALDLEFVKGLLKVTGPIFLAPYNEDISADNLAERAQYYSGFDYTEGTSDKKSFLTVLGSKLLERIFALKKEDLPKMFSEIQKSFDQKHMSIYFSNSPINSILKTEKWDGSLVDTNGDYLYVVNSNLGGTKANYYVKNKMTYEVNSMTRDGLLRANLYLDYENTAETDAWPGGPYTDYVRVLSQAGSKLTGAKIILNGGEEVDIFNEIVVTNEGRYNSFETSFKINPKETARIVISYDLPINLSITKEQKKYSLLWQKQPGTVGDEYFFILNPPFGTTAEVKSDNLSIAEASLKASGVIERDLIFYTLLK